VTFAASHQRYASALFREDCLGGLALPPSGSPYYHLSAEALRAMRAIDSTGACPPDILDEAGIDELVSLSLLQRVGAGHLPTPPSGGEIRIDSALRTHRFPPPLTLEWYPSFICNLGCTFCYMSGRTGYVHRSAGRPEIDAFFSHISEVGIMKVALLGGEPTAWPGLSYFLDASSDYPYQINVSTNGLLAPPELVRSLKGGSVRLTVSLQSHLSSEHDRLVGLDGAHARALQTIRSLSCVSGFVTITTVFRPQPFEECEAFLRSLRGAAGPVHLVFLYDQAQPASGQPGSYYSQFEETVSRARDLGCTIGINVHGSNPFVFLSPYRSEYFCEDSPRSRWLYGPPEGRTRLVIDPNGDIFPSFRVFGDSRYCLGNVYNHLLKHLWRASDLVPSIENRRQPEHCRKCDHFPLCQGGMTFENLERHGDMCPDTPACPRFS